MNMKYVQMFWKWCLKHISYVQGVLVLSVTVISAISGITSNYLALLVALLVFVGTEFTVITIGYLEPISKKEKTENGVEKSISEVTINENIQWKDLVENAQHDLFFSGVTLGSLYQERRILKNIPNNIHVRIIVHNVKDDEVTRLYCITCNPKATFQELKEKQKIFNVLSKDLKKKENIEIRMTNMPLYIQFLGCDILEKSEKSYIRAQHCLRKNLTAINPIDDKLVFGVDGGKILFDIYRNQVMILWNNATDYLWEE